MNQVMILSAKYLVYVVILLAIVFFFLQKRNRQRSIGVVAVIGLPLSYLVAKILGKLYYDPRPFVTHHFKPLVAHAADNGFPSDHALLCFAIATLVFVFNKKWGIVLGVLSVLVGISRIYVGIHSPIDIAGGIVIGGGVVLGVYYCIKHFTRLFHSASYE